MSLAAILSGFLLFLGLVFGLGLPWVVTSRFEAAEKLALGAGAGLAQIYGFAWIVYLTGLSNVAFLALPLLAAIAIGARLRALVGFFLNPEVRGLGGRQLLFMVWCLGWLALVRSYGGGEWVADWYEHYERVRFFLDRQPLNTMFLDGYNLPARPPLANLVVGAGMALCGTDFAHFQLFNTLFSALVILPGALLARHFARGRSGVDGVLLLMFMLSPLVVQNATFAWTKLPAAFFVLLAVAFYVRGLTEAGSTRRTISIGALSAALLTHYSAGPYAVTLAVAQGGLAWLRRREKLMWRELALQTGMVAALLATWLAWSVAHYGVHATFLSSTSTPGDTGFSLAGWLDRRAWNAYVTFVPHPLRPADYRFIAQTSALGFVRDYFFNIFQTTLPGAFGAAGLVLLAWCALNHRQPVECRAERQFWRWFFASAITLGIAAAYWTDRWGVVHICLLTVVIIGLAWLAARFGDVPAFVRRLWAGALLADAVLGIALQFYLQATVHVAPITLSDLTQGKILELSQVATKNMLLKLIMGCKFVADGGFSPGWVVALLSTVILLVARQVFAVRSPRS
jgi:hypothetical protein